MAREKWLFPVVIEIDPPPANAGEAQKICAQIEEAMDDLPYDGVHHVFSAICLQPTKQ